MSPRQKRFAWFFGIWAGSVLALAAVSLTLKLGLRLAGLSN